jgi:hypothetical protein
VSLANSELYRALVEAGASNDAAFKAAESVAGYDKQLAAMDTKLERMDGRLNTLTWMVGTTLTLTVVFSGGIIWQLLSITEKIGALSSAVERLAK